MTTPRRDRTAPTLQPVVASHSLLDALVPGEAEERFFYVTGGILEVQPYLVTVLADTALHAEQLDEDAAMAARQAAEEAMRGAEGKEDLARAQEQMVEAAARYRAAQKLRGKR